MEEFKWIKGPSKEQIRKSLKSKSLEEKFEIGVKNNIIWLVKECIESKFLGVNLLKLNKYRIEFLDIPQLYCNNGSLNSFDIRVYYLFNDSKYERFKISTDEMYDYLKNYIKIIN